jgi:DNA-binding NtrC family response regulator
MRSLQVSDPNPPSHAALDLGHEERWLVGASAPMREVLDRVTRIGHSEAPVLITGESGTGKELVARALHYGGPRRQGPFVAINCAAFPDTLIESELFGHGKGAFTGAATRREGRFKMADHGTLFLDEIGELSLYAQAKLLRVLQEGTIEPLGVDETTHVDVRILAATHRDLEKCVEAGTFREDLYYRIKVLTVHLPALRDRPEDLPTLVDHLVRRYSRTALRLSARALGALERYPFPGNVRELENVIQHALVMAAGDEIDVCHLPGEIAHDAAPAPAPSRPVLVQEHEDTYQAPDPRMAYAPLPLNDARRAFERAYLVQVLSLHGGRRNETAKALGISRKNLWEKLRSHGVRAAEYGGSVDPDDDLEG